MDGGTGDYAATLQKVTRKFGSDVVLSEFSQDFPAKAVTGIVGPSGCGKSTMLRIVAGIDDDYQKDGVVSTLGQTPNSSFIAGDVALLSSQNALLPWRSAVENVRLPLDLRGRPKKEANEKALALLEDAHLNDLAHKYPHELSDGQKQRLRLAQSLVTEPKLLLLDEPFNAIDLGLRVALIEQVRHYLDATNSSRSAIIVAHSLEEIVALSDKVIIVEGNPSAKTNGPGNVAKPMRVVKSITIDVGREDRANESDTDIQGSLAAVRESILYELKKVANIPRGQ